MDEDQLMTELGQTEQGERLKAIGALYRKLEEGEKRFCGRFCIQCKQGCGSCCEHFTPDLTALEAEYLAFGMIKDGKEELLQERLQNWSPESITCPLYNWDDAEHHCMMYAWRPLICRLFGCSASCNKHGEPVFRKCKWNDGGHDIASEDLKRYPEDLVIMNQYGQWLEDTAPGNSATQILPEAVENALAKIHLLLMLEES